MFGFVDLEVTDATVKPEHGSILEVGIVIADTDLNEVASTRCLVKPLFGFDAMPPIVVDMHTVNGLLRDVAASGIRRYEAELQLVDFVKKYANEVALVPVGRSVHFDMNWMGYHMPRLKALFDRHIVDISSINLLSKAWRSDIHASRPNATPHRALSDCYVDLDTLRYYRQHLFSGATRRDVGGIWEVQGGDWDAIERLERDCFADRAWTRADYANEGGRGWVSRTTLGEIRGSAWVNGNYLVNMAVFPHWQRLGIGTKLLAQALLAVKAAGYTDCELHVEATDMNAIRFYRRYQFEICGFESDLYGPGRHALKMVVSV